MNCSSYCGCNPLYDAMFDKQYALSELKRYNKKGMRKETKMLFDALKTLSAKRSVTEIGSGIGILAINLTKTGVSKYTGTELSQFSLETAKKLVEEENLQKKITFIPQNLIENPKSLKPSSIILSDKVICCYPDMESFMHTTLSKAKKYYAIVHPKENIFTKTGSYIANRLLQFTKRKGFKTYIHSTKRIQEIISSYGFNKIFHGQTFIWEIFVYEKSQ